VSREDEKYRKDRLGHRQRGREGAHHLVADALHGADVVELVGEEGLELRKFLRVHIHHETVHVQNLFVDVCLS
jgi:hypothetical protein